MKSEPAFPPDQCQETANLLEEFADKLEALIRSPRQRGITISCFRVRGRAGRRDRVTTGKSSCQCAGSIERAVASDGIGIRTRD